MATINIMNSIQRLDAADKKNAILWNDFVDSCENATFFHKAEWQLVLNRSFPHETFFLYSEHDGRIDGVLPMAWVKSRLFGQSLVSLPFTVYGGIASESHIAKQALETAAQRLAIDLGVDFLEFRNIDVCNAQWASQSLYYTFRKEICGDDASNLAAIPRKQRAMIRKGIAANLTSVVDRDVSSFYRLYADNLHRHGTPPLPKVFFDTAMLLFGDRAEILTVTDSAGTSLSAVLSFYFRNEILPYYAGDIRLARDCAANDFKYWELMRRAVSKEISIFDFGRSKEGAGSFNFKKNWGFVPQPLHYEYCLYSRDIVPQNNPSNKKFDILIRTWRRLPLPFVNKIGRYVVSGLG